VTVHEQYRGELTRNGVDGEKVAIVMNTPDESLIQPLASTGARRASGERFTVAYHGTITAWYGVDVLVQGVAAARTRGLDIHAVVLGAGDALPAAQALAEELGVRDYIEFSGRYLPIEDALRTVADADCGVIPNPPTTLNRFILSNKLFEYVALGVPVVVSRLETIAAHFSPNEVTFFEPGDSRSLADALVWVATHRAEAAARAARARARSAPYAWSTNRARYVDLLDRVAS
jgi:glycosyltransferase involved in cell wall biosynthesis